MPRTNGTDDETSDEELGLIKLAKLEKVCKVGDSFDYAYDMGTPTDIDIDVLSEKFAPRSADKAQNEQIAILARNNYPMWECQKCDKTARSICTECFKHFCGKRNRRHGCDSEMILDVANSPNCGFCGYFGNTQDEGDRFNLPEEEEDADNGNEDDEDVSDD